MPAACAVSIIARSIFSPRLAVESQNRISQSFTQPPESRTSYGAELVKFALGLQISLMRLFFRGKQAERLGTPIRLDSSLPLTALVPVNAQHTRRFVRRISFLYVLNVLLRSCCAKISDPVV